MTLTALAFLAVCCVFALGSGVSIGWILCERHRRANPEGVARVAQSAAQQMEVMRADFEKQRELWIDHIAGWQAHAANLVGRLHAPPPPREPTSPPEPPRSLDPDQSAARVLREGVAPITELRDALMEKGGLSAEKADAILDGKLDQLPPEELLSQLTDDVIRGRTGVT